MQDRKTTLSHPARPLKFRAIIDREIYNFYDLTEGTAA